MDLSIITQQLKGLPADRTINETIALQYVQTLKTAIITGSDPTAIMLLTKLLDSTPKSDAIFKEFDDKLMIKLLGIAQDEDIPANVTRSILRIWLTYLAGVIPITRSRGMFNPLLESIYLVGGGSDVLVKKLTKSIKFSDSRMNLNIVDFIAKVLYRIIESINSHTITNNLFSEEEKWLVGFLKSLYINDFFGTLCSFNGVEEIKKMTGLPGSMELVSDWINNKHVSMDSPYWLECVKLSNDVGIKLESPMGNCDLLPILVIIGVLSNPKKSLFKTLVECSLDESFPLLSFVMKLSNEITKKSMTIFSTWNTSLWYSLLNVSSRSWLFSGAKLEHGDEDVIIKSTKVMIDWLIDQLKACESNENIPLLLDDLSNFKYEDLRRLQLDKLHKENISNLGDERIKDFKSMIHDQVISFVKDERFMELSKGSWVYASNPLAMGGRYHGTWYFITLSANSQSIIFKEFPKRYGNSKYPGISSVTTAPNIDKDCIKVELKSVTKVSSEDLSVDRNQTTLITMSSQRMIVNKIEIVSPQCTIVFYVNTIQLKEIWDDGLNMLLHDGEINGHILDQISKLESIATRTQFLSLESDKLGEFYSADEELPISMNFNFNFH